MFTVNARSKHHKGFFNFTEEVDSFHDLVLHLSPTELPLTRKRYHSLISKEQQKAKRTNWFCQARFKGNLRKEADITGINLLVLDIDKSGKAFEANIEEIKAQFKKYNYIIYQTASSTRETPRYRFVLHIEEITSKIFVAKAARALLLQLDLDEEVLSANQLYFGPSHFQNEESIEIHNQVNKKPFPNNRLKSFIEKGLAVESSPDETNDADLVSLVAPTDLTDSEVLEVLEHVDPEDGGRTGWLNACFAIAHQYSSDKAKGFEIFDAWSKKGKTYDEKEAKAVWRSAKTHGQSGSKTFRYLIRRAQKNGYDASKHIDYSSLADENITSKELRNLIENYLKKGASPHELWHHVRRAVRLVQVTEPEFNFTKAELLETTRNLKKEQSQESIQEMMESFSSYYRTKYVLVGEENACRHIKNGFPIKVQAFGNMAKSLWYAKFKTEIPNELISKMEIATVERSVYDPTRAKRFVKDRGIKCFNIYNPPPTILREPTRREQARIKKLVDMWMRLCFINQTHRVMYERFLAHVTQYPGRKILWAPVVCAGEATGKSFTNDVMRACLGEENCQEVGSFGANIHWNRELFEVALNIVEEVSITSDVAADRWKTYITAKYVQTQRKNQDSKIIRNRTNFILLTNKDQPIPTISECPYRSRRWYFMNGSRDHDQNNPHRKKAFKALYDSIHEEPDFWRYHFLNAPTRLPNMAPIQNSEDFLDRSEASVFQNYNEEDLI